VPENVKCHTVKHVLVCFYLQSRICEVSVWQPLCNIVSDVQSIGS